MKYPSKTSKLAVGEAIKTLSHIRSPSDPQLELRTGSLLLEVVAPSRLRGSRTVHLKLGTPGGGGQTFEPCLWCTTFVPCGPRFQQNPTAGQRA